jgi:hypothetical protein
MSGRRPASGARARTARARSARARTATATAVLALALPALLAAGCGSPRARIGAGSSTPQAVRPSLATSAVSPAGNGLAIVEMGGSPAQHDNFWQLFTRTGSAGRWALATPKGVADNGGLVVAARGAGSLVTGFVPSQDLTFSPIATTGNNGASWSPGPVSGGLASLPDALAAAPDGRLLAILRAGGAELSAAGGTSWKQLANERSLAATPAGRACGLRNITAGAFGASAGPLLAGDCTRPGTAGIFALSDGHWQLAGPALPAALAAKNIDVIRLASTSAGEVALLAAGTAGGESLIAAWSSGRGRRWTLATPFRMGASQLRSASLGPAGEVGIVLTAGRGAVIAGPGALWRRLPALPARTATLAPGPGAQAEALADTSTALSVWRLAPGAAAWNRVQIIKVPVPYGSSG